MNRDLSELKLINKVEAPPFLWTRIEQKIENNTKNTLSVRIQWAFGIAMFLIILSNGIIMIETVEKQKINESYTLLKHMQMIENNSYNY